jgi:SAM-dependent methyltransferase
VETTEQAAWDQRYSGPDLVWGAGPNRFVTGEVTALPAGRAIDLGTGEGRNAIWLAERGWQVTAVDFSAAGLARAARLAAERADLQQQAFPFGRLGSPSIAAVPASALKFAPRSVTGRAGARRCRASAPCTVTGVCRRTAAMDRGELETARQAATSGRGAQPHRMGAGRAS